MPQTAREQRISKTFNEIQFYKKCSLKRKPNRELYQKIKDVRAKIFYLINFLNLLLRSDNDLLVSEMK